MSEPEFNISLGGGLYMDSNGDVHRGPVPAKPTYPMPGGDVLPISKEAFEQALTGTTQALQGVAKALPDANNPDRLKMFTDLGVPEDLIKLLGSVGEVAAECAKVIPIVGAAVVFLEGFIKLFSSGRAAKSPLELMIEAQFAGVHRHLKAKEVEDELHYINDRRDVISAALTDLHEYVEEVKKFEPTLAELQRARAAILTDHENAAIAVKDLLQKSTWLLSYDPDSFRNERARLANWWPPRGGNLLHLMPAGSPPPPPKPAPTQPDWSSRFEHGMMVPAVMHAVQSYLLLIKALVPEYRSTGAFNDWLREFAPMIENLTNAMRDETLARTIYPVHPENDLRDPFSAEFGESEVIGFGDSVLVAPTCRRFPVGAFDLCAHTDEFFQKQREAGIAAGADRVYGPAILGNMNMAWLPPAKLWVSRVPAPEELHGEIMYRITNPEECAAAANAQSEVDYAKLLVSSGYMNLVQMTTLMRHLATEPDTSETVKGEVILLRNPEPTADVTVKSDDIVFTGVTECSARRELARCRAIVPISTQPLREDRMLPYRIVLRTFRSVLPPNRWHDPTYAAYYSTRYEQDPANDGFLRLVTETNDLHVLDEKELWPEILPAGSPSTSPRELVQHSDEVSLTADTFDWYVPVRLKMGDGHHFRDELDALRSLGWSGARRPLIPDKTLKAHPLPSSTLTLSEMLGPDGPSWQDGTQDWKGQRREMAQNTEVHIKYNLKWQADRLRITLENRPQDRNYVVFLVVEETLPESGQVLHTALPVPMNGQLTYVPQNFFDEEQAAIDRANHIVLDVATHYAESGPVGPEDPFMERIRTGDLYSVVGLKRLAGLAEQNRPTLLQEAVQRFRVPGG